MSPDRPIVLSARQIVLDKVDDEDQPRHAKVHNSLTTDGVSMPALQKGKKAIPLSREPTRKQIKEVMCLLMICQIISQLPQWFRGYLPRETRPNLFTSGTPYSSSSNEARVQLAAGGGGRVGRRGDNPRDIDREDEDALQARTRAQQDAVPAQHREQ